MQSRFYCVIRSRSHDLHSRAFLFCDAFMRPITMCHCSHRAASFLSSASLPPDVAPLRGCSLRQLICFNGQVVGNLPTSYDFIPLQDLARLPVYALITCYLVALTLAGYMHLLLYSSVALTTQNQIYSNNLYNFAPFHILMTWHVSARRLFSRVRG